VVDLPRCALIAVSQPHVLLWRQPQVSDCSETVHLYDLSRHHRDPFDRMLIATALAGEIPLVGSDRQFKKYKGLRVICQ
jgi:PIN domain nuclease of toxin-antitoxin system